MIIMTSWFFSAYCASSFRICAVPSHSVMSYSLWPHGLQPTRLLCPGNFPGESIGVGCHFLLQGIFPTEGLNPHSTCVSCIGRQILYRNCHLGSPVFRIHVNTIMKFSALHLVPSQSFVKFKKTRQGLQQDFRDDSTPLLYFSVTHKRMHGKKKKNAWVMTISLESSLQFSSFPICDY